MTWLTVVPAFAALLVAVGVVLWGVCALVTWIF
jgi:hypothetical protein